MKVPELYKILGKNGECVHGGSGKWKLPVHGAPGEWMPEIQGALVPCRRGYHLLREQDLLEWLGPTLWRAEYEGEIIEDSDKVVVRKARLVSQVEAWNERTARLFAADCAERVLPIYERAYPFDDRPRKAIEAARAFANGSITQNELDTASDAVSDAARDAARAAARDAAWNAARDAARNAARAARDAAWAASAAERKWQTERLFQYLRGEV